jgi:CubicO group peptidase (beta-lactamase class C family)
VTGDSLARTTYIFTLIAAGLIGLILIAGCTSSPATCTAAPAPATANVKNIGSAVPQFDAYTEKVFQRSGVPGMAVAIVQNDTVIYLRTFGVKNTTTREPVGNHTRFQLASISKSFTTATIASMVGDNELSWDDTVISRNPEFRLYDPYVTEHATLRDFLTHRTGLPAYAGDDLQYELGYNRTEIQEHLRLVKPVTGFRTTYNYTNAGVTAAAETAAKRAGMPWETLVTKRLTVPAGLANTSPRFADFASSPDHADTYALNNGTMTAQSLINDDPNSPAGGVSSTITDMTRYARLQVNEGALDGKQIIAAQALRETHTPQMIMASTNTGIRTYGMGWEIISADGRMTVAHGGDLTSGVSTLITLYPEDKMGIVVLTNAFPEGHSLCSAVTNGWSDLYFTGKTERDWYGEMDAKIKEALKP